MDGNSWQCLKNISLQGEQLGMEFLPIIVHWKVFVYCSKHYYILMNSTNTTIWDYLLRKYKGVLLLKWGVLLLKCPQNLWTYQVNIS